MDATSAFLRSAARAGSAPGQRLREMFGEIDGTDLITPKSFFFENPPYFGGIYVGELF